ncbi:MAG: A/G-specific adenine glycosylase, partial [Gammaproteobacteria bacterium]|nr:A/G-specific adenine glycosylase [Gammaproteobacteria bacterium]
MSEAHFAERLLVWFDQHGRKELPWKSSDPYRVWISEIMLQQTQVTTVIPYFERFITRFPDIATLAMAKQDEVLHLWTGLGYYARARNLHKAAQIIQQQYQGRFPEDFDQVIALPGIGRSTAGAILAQAMEQRHAILDGNVKRLLSRLYVIEGWPGEKQTENKLWQLAEELTPRQRIADYTQAVMDIGATLCKRSKPDCDHCPFHNHCQARRQGRQAELPHRKPKKDKPVKRCHMLILQDAQGHVLLQQRPPSGIWGGLWSLPECPEDIDILHWSQAPLGLPLSHTT